MTIKRTNIITYKLMQKEYGDLVNRKNILHISRFRIWKIFKKESREYKNIYLRNVVSEWLDDFVGRDEILFSKIKRIIRKTKIKLTDMEKDGLFVLEERAFSEIRKIKIIEVNNKLYKGETVGVKYNKANLYDANGRYKKLFEGDLLISNKRIIFDEYKESFRFSSVVGYSNKRNGFEFKMKDGRKFLIRIHDSKTLNNTFNNIINKKVKSAIKEY